MGWIHHGLDNAYSNLLYIMVAALFLRDAYLAVSGGLASEDDAANAFNLSVLNMTNRKAR